MIKRLLILLTAAAVLSACANRNNVAEDEALAPLPIPDILSDTGSAVPDIATNLVNGLPGTFDNGAAVAPVVAEPQFARGSQEEMRAQAGDRIFFPTDSSELDARAQGILSGVAQWLNATPSRTLAIEGHADERGTREYNIALGDRRSNAVRNYLISQGVSPNRLQSVSFGKERPASAGSNPRSWALNRRAVFIVR